MHHNAFDALRLMAALAVLYSHSYALFGLPLPSPVVGQSFGSLAVYIFFSVSGYLVCSSWERDSDFVRFWIRRSARILPGLFGAVVFTTFVIGPLMTSLPWSVYFMDYGTWAYFLSNITMVVGRFGLPGVFENNPFANAANASLWTLRYEVLMYFSLSATGLLANKLNTKKIYTIGLLLLISGWIANQYIDHTNIIFTIFQKLNFYFEKIFAPIGLSFDWNETLNLGIFFFTGSVLYIHRHKLKFNLAIALVILAICGLIKEKNWANILLWISIPYFSIAFSEKAPEFIKKLCKNDYSYGVYIYAFPIQQVISWYFLKNNLPWIGSLLASVILTYLFSKISWTFIEHPSLQWKSNYLRNKSCQ